MSVVQVLIPQNYFLKDPKSTDLGKKIINQSVILLDEIGFENFTFRKLADCIDSTEASVYRYFENKLQLLLYLTTLYWKWVDYLIGIKLHYFTDPKDQLREILKIIAFSEELTNFSNTSDVDLAQLKRVVMTESDKTYLTKQVDEINEKGLFKGYKDLCHTIALIIHEVAPEYPYPHAIVSTILEASHQQAFFAMHLPSLTEVCTGKDLDQQVYEFLQHTLFSTLKIELNNGQIR